jgi:hypothetical protein
MLEAGNKDVAGNPEAQAGQRDARSSLNRARAYLSSDRTQPPLTPTSSIEIRQPIYRRAIGRWCRHAGDRGRLLEATESPVAKAGARSRPKAPNHA